MADTVAKPVVAKKPRAKPTGPKKPTTQVYIKEAILALKVVLTSFSSLRRWSGDDF